MHEIRDVLQKYDETYVRDNLRSLDLVDAFARTFVKDVAEIYDTITRTKNIERNPTGFSFDDAPVLGLLVRTWKLLKEIIRYYEEQNAEIISILERPLIEACVTATYLMRSGADVIQDYRKCSYKDRLRILRNLEVGTQFSETKAGKRLLKSIREKLQLEGFTPNDFEMQKMRRWRIQGKSFYDIFTLIEHEDLYACTYGMMSESIHGSWHETLEFCLTQNNDGTFSAYPFSHTADVRFISPTIRFTNPPFRLWLKRIGAADDYFMQVLDWIDRVNVALFRRFDDLYDDFQPGQGTAG